jgi:tetratricopeptide (TPR) repeat protein
MSQRPKWTEADWKALLAKAQRGDTGSQFWLGTGYEQGWFGKANFQEALKWLRKAAAHGDPDAQVSLGQMYEYGEGVQQNYKLAAKWYRKAAEHVPDFGGAGQGRNNLGLLYLDGLGVPKDYVQAYMWFSLANTETNLSDAKALMTPAQIQKAGRMAAEWKSRHPDPLGDWMPKEVPESCPVTKAPAHPLVPPYPAEDYPGSFWFGSEKLWINLPADGTWKGLPHYNPTDTAFRQKLLWWHKGFNGRKNLQPILKVNGKRLDFPAPTFEVEESANTYGGPDSRFIVVGIDIPTLGCWKIKGVFGAAELSFVIWVTQ